MLNAGSAGAPAGVPVSFYDVTGDSPVHIGRVVTTRRLLPGESETIVLAPGRSLAGGEAGDVFSFVAVLNDPDDEPLVGLNECIEDNNRSDVVEGRCNTVD